MKNRKGTILLLSAMIAGSLTACLGKASGGNLTAEGMISLEDTDYDGALELFKKAVSLGEETVPALRGAGMAYMGMGRYEEAIKVFDQALDYTDSKMSETAADILLFKASAQFRIKDYEGVIDSCDLLLEDERKSPDAFFFRGASYLNMDYRERAKEDFDSAVALDPNDYTLYLNIYESYESRKLSALGDEYLQTALNITPKDAQDYYRIGQIYYYLEQYDQAQSALLTPVNEKYSPALQLMGRIYLAQEDFAHARAMYENLQRDNGESTEIYNGLALCYIASGDYDTALEYIRLGLEMEGDKGKQELAFNEIVAYERKLDFVTARIKAQAYVSLYPTDEAGAKELEFLATR